MTILVLHASALHLGFLGCYGNTWIDTPHLDRLASEGITFDQHFADNLNERTRWTGQFNATATPMLPELMQANGCRFAHVLASQPTGDSEATPLEQTLDNAIDAIHLLAGVPRWLCWVDLPSLHPPWSVGGQFTKPYLAEESGDGQNDGTDDEPFEPFLNPVVGPLDLNDLVLWERLRCTYAGAVTYLDAGLGLLFDELKQCRLFDDLTIILTSERGLALGEHGIVGDCRPWLHEEVVHLPLIVRQPGAADAGLRVAALTQPADLAATLLDLFGVSPAQLDGKSLLPLMSGKALALRKHAMSQWTLAGEAEWALRLLDCALIVPANQAQRPVQFYLKPEDRWEMNNVIQQHLELAESLQTHND